MFVDVTQCVPLLCLDVLHVHASTQGWLLVQNVLFPFSLHQTSCPTLLSVSLSFSPPLSAAPHVVFLLVLFFGGTVVCYYPSLSQVIRLTSRFRNGKIAFAKTTTLILCAKDLCLSLCQASSLSHPLSLFLFLPCSLPLSPCLSLTLSHSLAE